jgi:hypothetical protein
MLGTILLAAGCGQSFGERQIYTRSNGCRFVSGLPARFAGGQRYPAQDLGRATVNLECGGSTHSWSRGLSMTVVSHMSEGGFVRRAVGLANGARIQSQRWAH